jgi:hypothetical protein
VWNRAVSTVVGRLTQQPERQPACLILGIGGSHPFDSKPWSSADDHPAPAHTEKGAKNVVDTIRDRLPHAFQRASFVMKSRQGDGAENPLTRVGVLVEYLAHLTLEVDR